MAIGKLMELADRIDHPDFREFLLTLRGAIHAGFIEWVRR